jgi:uridine kinase
VAVYNQNTIENLCETLRNLPKKRETAFVGIDGCGGAGKSTLSQAIKENLDNVKIVRMDDFYYKNHFDWQRFKRQVLEPLSQNVAAEYRRYDWQTEELAEWHKIEIGGILIVEGIYSTRKDLTDFYDFMIWVDCSREICLARGLKRDGESAREKWKSDWMPAEDFYVENDLPRERADLIVNGYENDIKLL